MNFGNWSAALLALALCGLAGCGSDSAGISGTGGAIAAGGVPLSGGAPAANGGAAAGGGPAMGGVPSQGGAASTGGVSASGGTLSSSGGASSSGGTTSSNGGATSGGAASSGGAVATGGAPPSSGGAPPGPIPTPVTAPQVWGFGIGVTDVKAASDFFTGVMKMTVEKDAVVRDDRTETVLYGTQANRGARIILMKFNDGRNVRKITAKLVWQSQNAAAINTAASKYPDYVSRLNFGIVQFDGPDTYIQEVGGIFDSGGAAITVPYPIALGFVVSDQPASRKFYTSLGMTESSLGSFSVTDVNGTGNITEYSVKFAAGTGVVVQQWVPARNAKDNPVKVVIAVPDAKAMADKITAAGGTIVKPAERSPAYDNRLLVVAKDLDGYVLEIVE